MLNVSLLVKLNLGPNFLEGTIPTELGTLTKLSKGLLSVLRACMRSSLTTACHSGVAYLSLYKNRLTGQIPTELGQLTALGT